MMKTQPPEAIYWIYFVNIPEIDPEHPVIWYAYIYDGPVDKAMEFTAPLHKIQHVSVQTGLSPMPELASLTFMGSESIGCAKGSTGLRFPIGLKSDDLPAVRMVFDDIVEISNRVPELSGSFFLLEGYLTQGVKAIDEKASAFPHRDDNILVTPYIMYKPNVQLTRLLRNMAKRLRNHLLMASDDPKRLRAYVNYAHGDEPLGAVYGWEDWRLGLLKRTKEKWDPENRMRFYNPLE
ncbi:FAD-dependent oxygenase [Colletotrichum tofieldiae]|nr:FAD-dependent oxygenase [Colletotrichum tofieldiae]GKT76061.1 FAD-dependent oxygenase [Colletotrichum tofieldiae]